MCYILYILYMSILHKFDLIYIYNIFIKYILYILSVYTVCTVNTIHTYILCTLYTRYYSKLYIYYTTTSPPHHIQKSRGVLDGGVVGTSQGEHSLHEFCEGERFTVFKEQNAIVLPEAIYGVYI